MSDQRDIQEMQEAEEREIMRVLTRIEERCGRETALDVAALLRYSKEYRQLTSERKVA